MVSARTVYSIENFRPAWRAHTKRIGAGYTFYTIFGIILICSSVVPYKTSDSSFLSLWIIFIGLLMISKPLWMGYLFNRNLKKNPVFGTTAEWEIDDNEMRGRGRGFQFVQEWHLFHEIHQSDDGLLIYIHKQMFYWIPKNGFASEEKYEEACVIVKEKAKKFTTKVRR